MKKVLKLVLVALIITSFFVITGCGNKAENTTNQNSKNQAVENAENTESVETVAGLTEENPVKFDREAGTVTFLAKVNGKYFYEPTRHGAVFKDGGNGDKAVFKGLVEPKAFHKALSDIGARSGDNMTLDNKEKTKVQGDAFDVTVTWTGAEKDYSFDEVIKDSNNTPLDIRFGGNLKTALDKATGCLICLDSCPVGITSNAAYTYGAVEKRNEVGFTGNKDILPTDGTLVAITLKLKK